MSRLAALFLAAAISAGCSTVEPVEPKRVEVKVPVPVPCRVTLPPEPAWVTDSLGGDAGIYDQVKALLAERLQRIGYEYRLAAAARSCQ